MGKGDFCSTISIVKQIWRHFYLAILGSEPQHLASASDFFYRFDTEDGSGSLHRKIISPKKMTERPFDRNTI
jgi:hypothetical protein